MFHAVKIMQCHDFFYLNISEYSVVDGFDETVKNVNAVLLSHKRLCADKIASLTQIIETNQKQTKLSMEKRQKKMIDVQRKSWEQKRKISLFGKEGKCQ